MQSTHMNKSAYQQKLFDRFGAGSNDTRKKNFSTGNSYFSYSSTKYTSEEIALKNWVTMNKLTLTFNDVKSKFSSDESTKFYIISQLVKHINSNTMGILEKIHQEKLWPKFEKSKQVNNYGLFHMASFVESGCDYAIFTRLVKLLYECGYSPFATNDRLINDEHETALMGLFQVNNRLDDEERVARYKIYVNNIPDKTLGKILNGYLNKTLDKAVDTVRFLLCINAEQVLGIIANNFIVREYKNIHLGTINADIEANVNFVLKVFSGADHNYRSVLIQDKSLTKFFELGEYKCKPMNELFDMLYEKMHNIILTSKNENKRRNEVIFVRMLGSFAGKGQYVQECNNYIFEQFERDNLEDLVHIICHVGYVTQEIKDELLHLDIVDTKVKFALENIFDEHIGGNITYVHVKDDILGLYNNYVDLDMIETIQSIESGRIESKPGEHPINVRDMFRRIKKVRKQYPESQALIVRQILFTLLDNATLYNKNTIVFLVKELINDKYLSGDEIEAEANYVRKLMGNCVLDSAPHVSDMVWGFILESL